MKQYRQIYAAMKGMKRLRETGMNFTNQNLIRSLHPEAQNTIFFAAMRGEYLP